MLTLAKQIEALNQNLAARLPVETLEIFGRSIQDLKSRSLEESSIKTGEKFPDFNLPDTNGEMVSLKGLLKNGKVIAAFFRGSWCPYCNLELKALQERLKQITDRKATLVAISPQKPDFSRELKDSHQLGFDLLTDKGNTLAKQLGISFGLQDYVVPAYAGLGIALSDYNENNANELPVPAVFVIDTDRTIVYKFADANYMNRVNVQELMEQL